MNPKHLRLPKFMIILMLYGFITTTKALVAVGSFINNTHQGMPLSYTSEDAGIHWSLSPILPQPSGSIDNELLAVSCHQNHCTAVGFYIDGTTNPKPLTYVSHDAGLSWHRSHQLPEPQSSIDDKLTGVFCRLQHCVTIGYTQQGQYHKPISHQSHDEGETWTLSETIPPPMFDHSDSHLKSIACADEACVAAGYYTNLDDNILPLVYVSSDLGLHWAIASTLPPPPEHSSIALLQDVSCHEQHCGAIGAYYPNGPQALGYFSSDSGITWERSSIMPAIEPEQNITLTAITCGPKGCISVGYIQSSLHEQRVPVSFVSSDYGQHWEKSAMQPLMNDEGLRTELHAVHCEQDACTAVGFFDDGRHTRPVGYYSLDFGQTWVMAETEVAVLGVGNHWLDGLG